MEQKIDPQRLYHRRKLNPLYLPYYDALCGILPPDWKPYCSDRTIAAQDALFAQGRTAAGKIVTAAQGGESAHNYGCATDWTLWDDKKPLWLKKEDPRWKPYLDALEKVGLKGGWLWGDYYHNELPIKISWRKVNAFRIKGGIEEAQKVIQENLANSA